MERRKVLGKALFSSIIALFLCVSMLVGTTFAWFTDTVTSGFNQIAAGNLDIEVYNKAGDSIQDMKTLFSEVERWEPGMAAYETLTVSNVGSLALKYSMSIHFGNENEVEGYKLSQVLKVAVFDGEVAFADRNELTQSIADGKLLSSDPVYGHILAGGEDHTITIAIWWEPSEKDNNWNVNNGRKVSDYTSEENNYLHIDLGVTVQATQLPYEDDSFDNQYDADAPYPVLTPLVALPDSGAMVIGDDTFEITLPEALVNALRGRVTGLRLRYASPKADEKKETIVLDYADVVDQDNNVVDLEAMGNNIPFTVKLDVSAKFEEGDTPLVFHDDDNIVVPPVSKDADISYQVCHLCKIYIVDYYGDAYDKDGQIAWEDMAKDSEKEYPSDFGSLIGKYGSSNHHVLTGDMEADSVIYFGDNTTNTVDLNGRNITTTYSYVFGSFGNNCELTVDGIGTVTTNSGYAGYADSGSTLTVNGGTYELGAVSGSYKGHFYTQNKATTVINGGTFLSSDPDTPILYCINGVIEINGGFFQNTANPKQALLNMGNNLNYVNNQRIILRGGTFVNWNPMNSAFAKPWTNPTIPALIVLAEGYQIVSETQANGDIWYTVVPV